MDSQEDKQISIAIAAVAKLKDSHDLFLTKVASMSGENVSGGSFIADGNDFIATALGVPFRVIRRPICTDGYFMTSEYSFITQYEGSDLCLWCIYLDGNGVLYSDPKRTNRLSDYDNPYLPSNVVAALSSALLVSPVFAPRKLWLPEALGDTSGG